MILQTKNCCCESGGLTWSCTRRGHAVAHLTSVLIYFRQYGLFLTSRTLAEVVLRTVGHTGCRAERKRTYRSYDFKRGKLRENVVRVQIQQQNCFNCRNRGTERLLSLTKRRCWIGIPRALCRRENCRGSQYCQKWKISHKERRS